MIRDVHAIVHQLGTDILIEQLEVDAFLQRLIRCGIENVIDHLIEQGLLIDITVAYNLLQRLRSLGDGILIGTQDHGLRHIGGLDGECLQLERGIDGTVVGSHRKLMTLFDGTIKTIDHHGVLMEGLTLGLLHIFLQITERLVHLQVTGGLIETAVNGLIELFLLHLGHLFDIRDLQEQKAYEREAHDYGDDPNCTFLHCYL